MPSLTHQTPLSSCCCTILFSVICCDWCFRKDVSSHTDLQKLHLIYEARIRVRTKCILCRVLRECETVSAANAHSSAANALQKMRYVIIWSRLLPLKPHKALLNCQILPPFCHALRWFFVSWFHPLENPPEQLTS